MGMKIINGYHTYDNADEYDDAMAEWHQTGFELSLLKDSESPEDYKAMMDEHMADKHRMAKEVFYDPVFKGIEEDYDIPFQASPKGTTA